MRLVTTTATRFRKVPASVRSNVSHSASTFSKPRAME
jgi:hypothetical protein